MRVGFGFDAHEMIEGKALKLGGLTIDFPMGLKGHSDGDVVLHAVSDAILGACAAGDIGMYFRDDDLKTEGIDSSRILDFSIQVAGKANLRINNIDLVLVADRPKLSGSYSAMRESIASKCGLAVNAVSVKAKTTEGTMVRNNAIACFATVLLEES
jgi:2-C-methyl-D-erythritol 2,4-cyclodiphosphate synthase